MNKVEVIRKQIKSKCYKCGGIGINFNKKAHIKGDTAFINGKVCLTCKGTGEWVETIYYHIYKDKDGNKYCLSGDSIK